MECQAQPAKRKRKPTKRYLESDKEKLQAQPKPTRNSAPANSRRQSATDVTPAPSSEPDIDVVNDDAQSPADVHSEYSGSWGVAGSKGRSNADGPPARKKPRRVVVSESESEEDYMDTAPDHDHAPDDDDDDHAYISLDEKPSKSLKGKAKIQPNKSTLLSKGKKRKAPGRRIEHNGAEAFSATPKKNQKPSTIDDLFLDAIGDEPATSGISAAVDTTSPAPSKQNAPSPAQPPKKPKLPTIKKTKLPGSSGLNTPTSATVPIKKTPLDLAINAKLSHDGVRKTLMGKTDIDLSNKSIYQEIFLKTGLGGGSTPGRTKEEERRKELNRMKEEAKARRAAEAEHSFDLQAQFDKISRFEDRLKQNCSSALYPNFMAAKWREVYDKGQRKQREQEWRESNVREEGEVS